MTAALHTPAPWTAMGDRVVDERGLSIAHALGVTSEHDAANACLMAAAPEMLVAGKHLAVKLAEMYRAAGLDASECQAIRDWMTAVKKAEARHAR